MKIKSWPLEIKITAVLWVLLLVYCLLVLIAFWLGQTQWMTENNPALPVAVFFWLTGFLVMQAHWYKTVGSGFFAGLLRMMWDREYAAMVDKKLYPPSLSNGIPQSWRDEALGKRRREKGGHDHP